MRHSLDNLYDVLCMVCNFVMIYSGFKQISCLADENPFPLVLILSGVISIVYRGRRTLHQSIPNPTCKIENDKLTDSLFALDAAFAAAVVIHVFTCYFADRFPVSTFVCMLLSFMSWVFHFYSTYHMDTMLILSYIMYMIPQVLFARQLLHALPS